MKILTIQLIAFGTFAMLMLLAVKALGLLFPNTKSANTEGEKPTQELTEAKSKTPSRFAGFWLFTFVCAFMALLAWTNTETIVQCYERAQDGKDATAVITETQMHRSRSSRGRERINYTSKIEFDGHTKWMDGQYQKGERRPVVYCVLNPTEVVWGTTEFGFLSILFPHMGALRLLGTLGIWIFGGFCLLMALSSLLFADDNDDSENQYSKDE